jgi:hypothetical protein
MKIFKGTVYDFSDHFLIIILIFYVKCTIIYTKAQHEITSRCYRGYFVPEQVTRKLVVGSKKGVLL